MHFVHLKCKPSSMQAELNSSVFFFVNPWLLVARPAALPHPSSHRLCRLWHSLGSSSHKSLPHMANKISTSIPAPGWPRRPIRLMARPAPSPCSSSRLPRWLRHSGALSHSACASALCRHSPMLPVAMSTLVRECRFPGLGTSCKPGGNRRSP